jgi:hypothetical protein
MKKSEDDNILHHPLSKKEEYDREVAWALKYGKRYSNAEDMFDDIMKDVDIDDEGEYTDSCIEAIREGQRDIAEGRMHTQEEVIAMMEDAEEDRVFSRLADNRLINGDKHMSHGDIWGDKK